MKRLRNTGWRHGFLWMCLLTALVSLPPDTLSASGGEYNAVSATWSDTVHETSAAAPTLFASWWRQTLGNRTRIIQVTTVAVILGIFILQWRRT